MTYQHITTLLPFIMIAAACLIVMFAIAFKRNHALTALLTLAGLAGAGASLPALSATTPAPITPLIVMDGYALYYTGLIVTASFAVAWISYSYLEIQAGDHEEFYLLLLLATLGTAVLAASAHFASFFLGFELLSVSLYALSGYQRHNNRSIEAGVKYLILAAVSSAFILFGMALVYAQTGSMEFGRIVSRAASSENRLVFLTGLVFIIIGLGFKLAVVPFHLWTPDVYEGAPAPATAFIATVSKGGVFALTLRFLAPLDIQNEPALFAIFSTIAILSMFAGNLLALLQKNVKRILAYSSISHLGYLLVTLLADKAPGISAAGFYLAAYMVTMLGALGVVTVLSTKDRDADRMDDYIGLAWRKPWLAGIFTAMLLSLAGIPLTAGFVGKFYLVASGVGSALWLLVIILIVNSALSVFYYLRIIVAVYTKPQEERMPEEISRSGSAALACLAIVLVWMGVYPSPVLGLIQKMMHP